VVTYCADWYDVVRPDCKRYRRNRYSDIIADVEFVPFVIELFGIWREQAMSLVKELGCRMAEVIKEPRSTTFLRQRLSVAVQRGNAACILGTLRPVVGVTINYDCCYYFFYELLQLNRTVQTSN